ncbi:MAG: hypothetical protein E7658_02625 [Ruminococcaceae bacterium]|nr:hypothetical protein [Oscillospiraceae bacterium]
MNNFWNFYTAKETKPAGWLKRQLEIQAEGLSGNLDKVWPDVRDSAWIGGKEEGWERVPYWLDGFIPLAYLLDNEDMKSRAKKYIDAILTYQQPSGWICPCREEDIPTYDTWAVQLISKVLVVYYECSGDERIPDVVYRVLKNYWELLKNGTIHLFCWGEYRWFEAFIAIRFAKARWNEPWLDDLARILKEQGKDYRECTELWKKPMDEWRLDTHVVNLAMMLKYEAVSYDILNEPYTDAAEELFSVLREYNGTAAGMFTGDECLSGTSPIQGTELCAVAELMYSCEQLFACTGDPKWAERLEELAFNAFPATVSDDMWTHQYDQMTNQIACIRFPGNPIFRTNGPDAHLFGLEPNYGCCTANHNQAWPKFALSAFLYNGDTILSAIPVPSEVHTEDYHITLTTEYPFRNTFCYTVDTHKPITFRIRIPSFAKRLTVNGKAAEYTKELEFRIEGNTHTEIQLSYEADILLIDRPNGLKTVKFGSLIFSLPIAYEKKMYEYTTKQEIPKSDGTVSEHIVERKFPYCDYEYIPTTPWNYGYASDTFEAVQKDVTDIPFSSEHPPVTIRAKVKKIDWGTEEGYEYICAKVPKSLTPIGEEEEIELYPYGCAKLRMTELPLL